MLRIFLIVIAMQALPVSGARCAERVERTSFELFLLYLEGSVLDNILHEEARQPEKAVQHYSLFIWAFSPPRSDAETEYVAIAYYNRGLVLTRLERIVEAKRSYQALEDAFATSDLRLVRLQVAKSLVNLAYFNLEEGDYRATIDFAQRVDRRYSGANDAELGDDGFDLQVVKALNNEADAWNRLGLSAIATATTAEIFRRFRAGKSEPMNWALDFTRKLRRGFATLKSGVVPAPGSGPPPRGQFDPALFAK